MAYPTGLRWRTTAPHIPGSRPYGGLLWQTLRVRATTPR